MSRHYLTTLRRSYLKLRYLVDRGCVFVGHGLKKDFKMINIVVPPDQARVSSDGWLRVRRLLASGLDPVPVSKKMGAGADLPLALLKGSAPRHAALCLLAWDRCTADLAPHPRWQVVDTVELFQFKRQRKLSLRFLAAFLLDLDIQKDTHDSIEDARTAVKLYQAGTGSSIGLDLCRLLHRCLPTRRCTRS